MNNDWMDAMYSVSEGYITEGHQDTLRFRVLKNRYESAHYTRKKTYKLYYDKFDAPKRVVPDSLFEI